MYLGAHGWRCKWLNEAAADVSCGWRVGEDMFIVMQQNRWDEEEEDALIKTADEPTCSTDVLK